MEGLKIIARSTFDKHQKFRTGSEGSHRYSVIEIGAFGSPQNYGPSTTSKQQSIESVHNLQSVPVAGAGSSKHDGTADAAVGGSMKDAGANRVSFNEWLVYEDDLVAFMSRKPVEPASSVGTRAVPPQHPTAEISKGKSPGKVAGSAATSATGHSRSVSLQSSKTMDTSTTTATTATSAGKLNELSANKENEEVEAAAASVKLVCIPRAILDREPDADANTLAISREAFLRLYVDTMDADHGALYFLARGYDGFHEYNDPSGGTVTFFIGTADYALVWTFRRHTLETKGLFIDRKLPHKPKNTGSSQAQHTISTSKRSARGGAGATSTSNSWMGFRGMLRMYKSYIYAPHLLSFVSCLHTLHAFDDQVSASDVPQIREIESKLGDGIKGNTEEAKDGTQETESRPSVQAVSRQSSAYAVPVTTEQSFVDVSPETPKPLDNEKFVEWAQASGEITDSVSRKLRQLKMSKELLDVIAREHETAMADVVAPAFLDRYHWAMEGINEAIPAVERHMVLLEESMLDLKARTERLNALISALLSREQAGASRGSIESSSGMSRIGGRDLSSVDNVAVMIMTFMPATLSAAMIAIASLRFSLLVPCIVLVYFGWLTVTQRKWLVEVLGHNTEEKLLRPGRMRRTSQTIPGS